MRAYNLSAIFLADIAREFSWHVLGQRRFYTNHFQELVNAHKWCFIVGCNNSGTSLVKRILENSNKVSTLPYEGQIYTRVFPRASRKGHERVWSEYLGELGVDVNHPLIDAPRLLHDWMKDLDDPVKDMIAEKTPANVTRMGWLQRVFPNSFFVGVVRNGYAVAEGIRRKSNKSLDRAARHWNRVNKNLVDTSGTVHNFFTLCYEELCDQPEETVTRLAEFLGLETEPLKQGVVKDYSFRTIAGHRLSMIQNFNERSMQQLSRDDIAEIRANAAEMLDHFGYEPS